MRFTPSPCGDSVNRFVYAIESPLRVMTPSGAKLSLLNPVTEMVGGILVTSVHPGGLSVRRGVAAGATGIAGESAWSLVREFWPWHTGGRRSFDPLGRRDPHGFERGFIRAETVRYDELVKRSSRIRWLLVPNPEPTILSLKRGIVARFANLYESWERRRRSIC
jgi:hypothetical protein